MELQILDQNGSAEHAVGIYFLEMIEHEGWYIQHSGQKQELEELELALLHPHHGRVFIF